MMKHNDLFKRLLLATFFLVAGTSLQAQALLPDQHVLCRETMHYYLAKTDSLTLHEGFSVPQTYKAFQCCVTKRALHEHNQWRQDRQMAGNSDYWTNYSYNDYSIARNTPHHSCSPAHSIYDASFRWNDVATITSLALSAYILFR